MEGMKTFLLISGIIIIAAGALFLAFAAFNNYGYHHAVDGEPSLYKRLHKRKIIFSSIGFPLLIIGIIFEIAVLFFK